MSFVDAITAIYAWSIIVSFAEAEITSMLNIRGMREAGDRTSKTESHA